jgi:hypothetical protein
VFETLQYQQQQESNMLKAKYNQRKLILGKHTIRSLTNVELRDAAGGRIDLGGGGGGGSDGPSVDVSLCNGCSFFSVSQCP